jgi:glycerol-3-phosphate dehydrogenase (NAD(P)+)
LPKNVVCVEDVETALRGAETVVFVVPSHATRDVARAAAPHLPRGVPVVSATKGIENDSLMFMDEILSAELPAHARPYLAFLSGPSFARELALGQPTAVVVAAHRAEVGAAVMRRFHTPYLRTYASDDVAGVECGGALKNVIAIAAGAVDGMGFGHNARAALITRGLAELARLAMARGGSALTLAGLAGLGDLVLTCTGEASRNRTVGYEMGRGRKLADVLGSLGHVAEGVKTAKSAYDLAKRLGVEMPITNAVYSVLYEDKPVEHAVRDLMTRELGYEFDPRAVARATLR